MGIKVLKSEEIAPRILWMERTRLTYLPLMTLDGLLKIKNRFIGVKEMSFKVCDVLRGICFCLLVLRDLLLEGTDGLRTG